MWQLSQRHDSKIVTQEILSNEIANKKKSWENKSPDTERILIAESSITKCHDTSRECISSMRFTIRSHEPNIDSNIIMHVKQVWKV